MKWFRLYDELVDDPKMILLPADIFRSVIFLWCVASQNDGYLPPVEAVAIKLRLPVGKTRKLLTDLKVRGLLDQDENGCLYPHNWRKRQFKTDKADPTNNDRQKRYRNGQRNGDVTGDRNGKRNAKDRYGGVTDKRPESETESESDSEQTEQHPQKVEAAPARGKSLISPEAHTIAEELWQAAGFSKENLPPGWCGAAHKIQQFLTDGCPGEVLKLAVVTVLKRKTNGPPEHFGYFERPIAQAFADHKRPLPTVSMVNPQPIEVRNGYRTPTTFDIAARRIQAIESDPEGSATGDRRADSGPVIELE